MRNLTKFIEIKIKNCIFIFLIKIKNHKNELNLLIYQNQKLNIEIADKNEEIEIMKENFIIFESENLLMKVF